MLAKWRSEETPLLFREKSSLHSFALLGVLESADSDTVRFRIEGFGYIDTHFPPGIAFEYFDPATQRDTQGDAIQEWNIPESPATGAGVIATTPVGEVFTFVEILLT
ncbi:MAG TPA: hypothetical protein VE195_09165 [Acidobacteriaceae bacterium]|jgi:hypothetical protein|nr:hypothetical protein [Acidobacteriaceae bacterium]